MTEEEELREALKTALDALKRIARSDPGPGYYVAKGALESIPAHLRGEDLEPYE